MNEIDICDCADVQELIVQIHKMYVQRNPDVDSVHLMNISRQLGHRLWKAFHGGVSETPVAMWEQPSQEHAYPYGLADYVMLIGGLNPRMAFSTVLRNAGIRMKLDRLAPTWMRVK